jgi:hypothetical protein
MMGKYWNDDNDVTVPLDVDDGPIKNNNGNIDDLYLIITFGEVMMSCVKCNGILIKFLFLTSCTIAWWYNDGEQY